mgnify:CR=1 FL=1
MRRRAWLLMLLGGAAAACGHAPPPATTDAPPPIDAAATDAAPPRAVLFVGNSYTYYFELPVEVAALAPPATPLITTSVTVGGATLGEVLGTISRAWNRHAVLAQRARHRRGAHRREAVAQVRRGREEVDARGAADHSFTVPPGTAPR